MRILLIKPKQIGDSLVLTPTIAAIKEAHPGAEIWVVVRRGCEEFWSAARTSPASSRLLRSRNGTGTKATCGWD